MTIREQAEYHRILLAMGLERAGDVIQWADQLVLSGTVPVEVIDVSLAVHAKDHELEALLKAVPGEGDLRYSAHVALSRFGRVLEDLPLKDAVNKIAIYGCTAMVPENERQGATLFDALHEDMLRGYCGSENGLFLMLREFVDRYATEAASVDDSEVRSVYQKVLEQWNRRDAAGFAGLFAADGSVVGFDGSMVDGRGEIEAHLGGIFRDHPTPRYVGKVREVRGLGAGVVLVRAVAGMVPPGKEDLHPRLNAVQVLVAVRGEGGWRVAMFQNTPAAFHGRPEAGAALTEELRGVLREGGMRG